MGCGSLGTILGAYLNQAGLDVMMVDAWKEHVDVLNREGATVTGGVQMNVPVKACTPDQMDGIYDLIIYMAKQTFNEIAIPQMLTAEMIQSSAHARTDSRNWLLPNIIPKTKSWGRLLAGLQHLSVPVLQA